MSDDSDVWQDATPGARHETEPDDVERSIALADAVAEQLHALDDGSLTENITVRDARFSALLAALDETGEMAEVNEAAWTALDRDVEAPSRSALMNALARLGLREVAPEVLDEAGDGYDQYRKDTADKF